MIEDGFLNALNTEYFGPGFTVSYDDIGDGAYAEEEEESALPDLGGREVTVVVENAYLPFNYVDLADGLAKGWDYDAIDEICARLNCVPVYVEAVWEGMIQGVADGQWDVAADGITITEDRDEIVDFSMGYVSIDQRLLVRLDEDRIEEIEDIANDPDLILGTQVGTTNYETASQFIDPDEISTFDTFPFAISALIAGDIDAVMIDEVAGLGYLGENADVLKLVGRSLSSDVLGFAFPNGSDLVAPFNQALIAMIEDGFLNALNTEYFGPGFTVSYDDIGDGAYTED
ncbi:MAG: amino acid ABC transporter substrate-binding protein [Chloroflexi bacterium]|nr:amino acid ABC transporter substrate-binding protein [Chloroflexota bacterium]